MPGQRADRPDALSLSSAILVTFLFIVGAAGRPPRIGVDLETLILSQRNQAMNVASPNAQTPNAKTLFTGKTHSKSGSDGYAKSADGFVDLKMPEPHPAAENLFAAAWSACYMGALELAAGKRKIKLEGNPEVDAQIDLNLAGSSFFLKAHFDVKVPGVDRAVAEELAEAAHGICPYSKAVHGNIEVTTVIL
jgi:osmotically inducible protein OsmC